jgi:hypothetical protein
VMWSADLALINETDQGNNAPYRLVQSLRPDIQLERHLDGLSPNIHTLRRSAAIVFSYGH